MWNVVSPKWTPKNKMIAKWSLLGFWKTFPFEMIAKWSPTKMIAARRRRAKKNGFKMIAEWSPTKMIARPVSKKNARNFEMIALWSKTQLFAKTSTWRDHITKRVRAQGGAKRSSGLDETQFLPQKPFWTFTVWKSHSKMKKHLQFDIYSWKSRTRAKF